MVCATVEPTRRGVRIIEDTIHNFIQTAAKVFKRFYGTYPERLGLDMFTRMKQYNKLHFFEYYHWQETHLVEQLTPIWQWSTYSERIKVKIDPAVFGKIECYLGTPIADLNKKPERGYDEVICEGNGISVFMTLWFTESGYHSIIWDKEKK